MKLNLFKPKIHTKMPKIPVKKTGLPIENIIFPMGIAPEACPEPPMACSGRPTGHFWIAAFGRK